MGNNQIKKDIQIPPQIDQSQSVKFNKLQLRIPDNTSEIASKVCCFNSQLELCYSQEFLSYLKKNQNKAIKVITFIGPTGAGKSTIMNMIIREYLQDDLKMIFNTSSSDEQVTIGIDYYALENEKSHEIYLFLDCQGFQGVTQEKKEDSYDENEEEQERSNLISSQNTIQSRMADMKKDQDYEIKLTQLLSLICGISTCVFYVTINQDRTEKCFKILLDQIDIDRQKEYSQSIQNFVKITNKSSDEFLGTSTKLLENRNIWEKAISQLFSLTSFRREKIQGNQREFLYVTEKYSETLKQIRKYIDSSKFRSSKVWMTSYLKQQSCLNFYDVVENAFDVINQGFEKSAKNFLEIVNHQLLLKQQFRERCDNIKKESEVLHDKIFQFLQKKIKDKQQTSLSLCLILQDFVELKGYRDLLKKFEEACEKWKKELIEIVKKLLENNSNHTNHEQQRFLLDKYVNLKSIQPDFYRIKDKIIGEIKAQENSNIAKRQKIAVIATTVGVTGLFVGLGILSEAVIITTSLFASAFVLPGLLLIGGIYCVSKCSDEKNRLKTMKRIKKNLRESLSRLRQTTIPKWVELSPDGKLQFMRETLNQQCVGFGEELNKIGDIQKRNCFVFNFYFNNMKAMLQKKHLEVSSKKENLELFEYGLRLYQEQNANANISFSEIFTKKVKLMEGDYQFQNEQQKLTINNESDLGKSIQQFEHEPSYDLFTALVVLRNIESYFIIEIIRQTHFKDIVGDICLQEMIINEQSLEEFFDFQKRVLSQQ